MFAHLQKAVDGSALWARINHIKYHDGVSCCIKNGISQCKKFPEVLVYAKKGMSIPEEFFNLVIGNVVFKMTYKQRNLGLNVCTGRGSVGYKNLVDRWGYYFRPELDRIKTLAYRMQDIKFDFVPHFMKMMILCYFCGIINFCACLYWLRSSEKDLGRLRFYYIMGVSAVIGETAMGTLGASCCKKMVVGEDSKRMKALLDMVGLKSVKEIAMTDAVSTVKQVVRIRPHWFEREESMGRSRRTVSRMGITEERSKRYEDSHEAVRKAELPNKISEEIENTKALIGDIWRLACDKVIIDYEKVNDIKTVSKNIELWKLAEEVCKRENPDCKFDEILLTYHAACRDHLGTVDIQARRLGNLTVSQPLRPNRTCFISPPSWKKPAYTKKWTFGCHVAPPNVGKVTYPCVVCGGNANVDELQNLGVKIFNCKSCKRLVHNDCLSKLCLVKKEFCCRNVDRFLGEGAIELMPRIGIDPKPLREDERCLVCGDSCTSSDAARVDCCIMNCKYGAHEVCIAILAKLRGWK